jgi:predicted RNase H-like HicB family nuclease
MSLQAIIYQDESGAYCAEVPALPGCHSCGDTYEEALANIREAATLWIECANG